MLTQVAVYFNLATWRQNILIKREDEYEVFFAQFSNVSESPLIGHHNSGITTISSIRDYLLAKLDCVEYRH